jgi:glycosyltransferase involved in cell wall biosynthesis
LFVINVPWFFVMHRMPFAIRARELGYDVHIACGVGPGEEGIRREGFAYHQLSLTRTGRNPFGEVRAVAELARLYRDLRPGIVHHVTIKPIIYGSIAARKAGVPAVINAFAGLGYAFSARGVWADVRRRALLSALRFALSRTPSSAVFENDDDRELLESAGVVRREHAHVLPGVGADTTVYRPSPEPAGRVRVVLASRMLWEKGVGEFVRAAELLHAEGVDAEFWLVGDVDKGNPGSLTRSQLEDWHSRGVIVWRGFESDMPRLLRECHVVCLPTYYREGIPRILLEAAASGRPIVATAMPGCREICIPEVTGLQVPPRDPRSLAAALKRLIADPLLRKRMGDHGRQLVEARFALPLVLDRMMSIYRDLS